MATKTNVETATLKIVVKLAENAQLDQKEIYAVGNVAKFGEWDLDKAVTLKYVKSLGGYSVSRKLNVGTEVEFKLLNAKSWNNVEKGMFTEEIKNHNVTVNEDTTLVIDVYHWN